MDRGFVILDYFDILRLGEEDIMHHNREKQQIMSDNPGLVLCENDDFKIKADLVK